MPSAPTTDDFAFRSSSRIKVSGDSGPECSNGRPVTKESGAGPFFDTLTAPGNEMLYYGVKVVVSALLIVAIAEIAKRSTGFAALVAAIPVTSLLAFVWLHMEASPPERIADLSTQIFWLVIPSLVLFLVLPTLLRHGLGFWTSLGLSVVATAGSYLALLPVLRRLGVGL